YLTRPLKGSLTWHGQRRSPPRRGRRRDGGGTQSAAAATTAQNSSSTPARISSSTMIDMRTSPSAWRGSRPRGRRSSRTLRRSGAAGPSGRASPGAETVLTAGMSDGGYSPYALLPLSAPPATQVKRPHRQNRGEGDRDDGRGSREPPQMPSN